MAKLWTCGSILNGSRFRVQGLIPVPNFNLEPGTLNFELCRRGNMSEIVRITQVSGMAVPIRGNDIDTDRIIPARYLKEVTFARMGEYPFFDERFDSAGKKKPHPFNDPKYAGA